MKRWLWLLLLFFVPQQNSAQSVSQSYSLTTTGPQIAINLTTASVDIHTISWRPAGTVSTCQVQVDTSPDGITWTAGGVIASQACTSAGQAYSASSATVANYVRINLTALSGGGILNVVYSGRFAPLAALGSPVSNGIWVTPSDFLVYWATPVQSHTSVPLFVYFRIQDISGKIHAYQVTATINFASGNFIAVPFSIPISGYLIGVQQLVQAPSSGTITAGDIYHQMFLMSFQQWQSSTAYIRGQIIVDSNGNYQYVTTAGISGNGSHPTWATTNGATTTDGTATWTCQTTASGVINISGNPPVGVLLYSDYAPQNWELAWSATGAGTGVNQVTKGLVGTGNIQAINISNPGAGVQWVFNSSVNFRYRIISIHYNVTTSSTVANRFFGVFDGTNNATFAVVSDTAQPASTTYQYTFVPGAGSIAGANNGGLVTIPLPDNFYLMNGMQLKAAAINFQSGDVMTSIWILAELWNEVD